ncbi:MAG: sulfurtransferase TusB, partial [Aquificae bacterium]|nr:sulfurtransferase TusB [Aquificota bacterium]
AEARGLHFKDEVTKSYDEIVELMEKAKRVVVW